MSNFQPSEVASLNSETELTARGTTSLPALQE